MGRSSSPLLSSVIATLAVASVLQCPQHACAAPPLKIPELKTFTVHELALPGGVPERFDVRIEIAGSVRAISAVQRSFRSPEFQVYVENARHELVPYPAPPVHTYRGLVDGIEGHGVALQLNDGHLSGLIDLGEEGTYFVQPAAELTDDDRVRPSTHVVYDTRDVVPQGGICGNALITLGMPDWMVDGVPGGGGGGEQGGIAGEQPQILEIAFDADFEFYVKNGSSVTQTVNDIETVMNGVDFIYDRDVNIGYEFTTFVVRTTIDDPYTSGDAELQLCEVRNKWNAAPENAIQREVVQLFTGKNLAGNTLGLAWVGVVCNQAGNDCSGNGNLAYSTIQSRYTTLLPLRQSLSAHEIGHNWNATHCDGNGDCHIMCATNGGCDGINGANLKFGAGEVAQIVAYRSVVSCDGQDQLPIAKHFIDTFPSGTLDVTKWTYVNGATSNTAALNEPSASFSMNLDTTGAGIYEFDEIRSNRIQLAGNAVGVCSYWTQHIGVETGKKLFVEYWSASGDWLTLNTITSDGNNQVDFVQWKHQLPTNALHDGFRLRFRTDSVETNDDWYVDDVLVGAVPSRDRMNSDLRSDIALHDSTNNAAQVWYMNGLVQSGGGATNIAPSAGWTAEGMGDFNGDGKADILWRDAGNVMRIWLMNGVTVVTNSAVIGANSVGATFVVIGIADIDGDGKADVLFRNTATNNVHAWLMDGVTRVAGGTIGNAGTLETVGTGDINGDGRSDIILRDGAGQVSGWLLNGMTIATQGPIANTPPIPGMWQIQAIGDLDGDGRADLVWRNTTSGLVSGWLLESLSRKQGATIGTIPLEWTLESSADLNGDTKGDLVWRNGITGQVNGWIMNGLTKVSGGTINTPATTWSVINR